MNKFTIHKHLPLFPNESLNVNVIMARWQILGVWLSTLLSCNATNDLHSEKRQWVSTFPRKLSTPKKEQILQLASYEASIGSILILKLKKILPFEKYEISQRKNRWNQPKISMLSSTFQFWPCPSLDRPVWPLAKGRCFGGSCFPLLKKNPSLRTTLNSRGKPMIGDESFDFPTEKL